MADPKQDVELTFIGPYYDISIDSSGDLKTEDSFDTNIITSLFTEARASKDQVVIPENRRGWIGSHNEEFILGSTLWVYGQLRNLNIELNELSTIAKLSLDHFIEDDIAKKITASIGIENNKAILVIRIERPNNQVDYRHFELWENTGI